MSDRRLRELERRWRESGTDDDLGALLVESIRIGESFDDVVGRTAGEILGYLRRNANTPSIREQFESHYDARRTLTNEYCRRAGTLANLPITEPARNVLEQVHALYAHEELMYPERGLLPYKDEEVTVKLLVENDELAERHLNNIGIRSQFRPTARRAERSLTAGQRTYAEQQIETIEGPYARAKGYLLLAQVVSGIPRSETLI